jgi:hypothetical protein
VKLRKFAQFPDAAEKLTVSRRLVQEAVKVKREADGAGFNWRTVQRAADNYNPIPSASKG